MDKKQLRLRFAPSPTGHVHIGNIRAAIFNWLLARNTGGKFLLRIEDTDRERSTPEACATLLEAMKWLGLDYDEEILYQSSRIEEHRKAANWLLEKGLAVRSKSADGVNSAVIFLLPYEASNLDFVRVKGPISLAVSPQREFCLSITGAHFYQLENGKEIERACSLAGLYKLKLYDHRGKLVFDIDKELATLTTDELKFSEIVKIEYVQREVFFNDRIKGELAKPLDTMKDFVILRADGTAVFHLANVCDDIFQNINFIMRGDDHVENTFRHLFLFAAFGVQIPQYAHLPMIVNQNGKPYSKRDGDAYVGDFKTKGFLPEALFNYLALLGWSPGDNREKMTREELIAAFSLERVKSSPAQFDIKKLINMNGQYIAEMDPAKFAKLSYDYFVSYTDMRPDYEIFVNVANLMQSRTKTFADVKNWMFFFTENYQIEWGEIKKLLEKNSELKSALAEFENKITELEEIDKAKIVIVLKELEEKFSLKAGSVNQIIRLILTGQKGGPPIEDIMAMLGKDKVVNRLKNSMMKI